MLTDFQFEPYDLLREREKWEEKNSGHILNYPLVLPKGEWDWLLGSIPLDLEPPIHRGAFSLDGDYMIHPEWDVCYFYELYVPSLGWRKTKTFGPYKTIGLAEKKVTEILVNAKALVLLDDEQAKAIKWPRPLWWNQQGRAKGET